MNITEVKIRHIYPEGRLRAIVSITINDSFVVHDIKIIEGPDRVFVAMPSRKEADGTFRDIAHPINAQVRQQIEEMIITEYRNVLKEMDAKKE